MKTIAYIDVNGILVNQLGIFYTGVISEQLYYKLNTVKILKIWDSKVSEMITNHGKYYGYANEFE